MAGYYRQVSLKAGERIDDLQRNGLGIIQQQNGFCFGMDAVLLSGFVRDKKGGAAVDLGTGTGIIPLLLSAKTAFSHIYGIEVQDAVAEMAARSIFLNGLEQKIDILKGDIREIVQGKGEISFSRPAAGSENAELREQTSGKTGENRAQSEITGGCNAGTVLLRIGTFDVVTANPPYMKSAHGLRNPEAQKAISRHEVLCTLDDVCAAAGRLLKEGGSFYMVHRPQRLIEITEALIKYRLEPKRIKFVHPFIGKEANMVLLEAVKGAGHECRVERPIIVYREPGQYTDEIYELYGY